MKRVLTALVLVPILIAIIGYAPPVFFSSWSVQHLCWRLRSISRWRHNRASKFFASQVMAARYCWWPACTAPRETPWAALLVLVTSCLLFFALGLRRGNQSPHGFARCCSNRAGFALHFSHPGIASRCPLICNVFGTREILDFLSPAGGLVRRHRRLLCGPCLG